MLPPPLRQPLLSPTRLLPLLLLLLLFRKKALKKAGKGKAPPAPPPVPAVKAEEATVDPADEEKERKKKERAEQEAKRSKRRIEKITLHVQVGNEDGKKFWEKFGFSVVVSHFYLTLTEGQSANRTTMTVSLQETVPNYYRKN